MQAAIVDVTARKLCYILHRGYVEARNLAPLQNHQQLADLADAFEPLPGFLADWSEENVGLIRSHLRPYQEKYPNAFDYLAVLEMEDAEFLEVLSRW